MLDDDENENEFLKEKIKDLEGELPKEEKHLRGWGNWAGMGVKERKPPSAEELL
jgi:U3 small nucleolar RNA-associated protein 14